MKVTVEDYGIKNPEVIYSKNGLTEVAIVVNPLTGETIETMELISDGSRATVTSHTLRRTAVFAKTTVQLTVHIELYNSGSFRQVNSVKGSSLSVTNAISNTTIEDKSVNVWSPTGFPTVSLKYAYSGTLTAKINSSASAQVGTSLQGAGFSFSGTISGFTYYRYPFYQNGTINLYN